MMKRYAVALDEAIIGPLHVNWGTSRRLIDAERSGAKYFSMFVNTLKAGIKTSDIVHDVEQGWYILSGKGKFFMEGEVHEIHPQMALFAPATGGVHRFEVDPGEDLTYVLVFAPPKPQ